MWGQRSGGGGGRRRRGVAVECRDDADAGGSEGDGSGDVSVRARVAVAVECRCDAGLSPSSVAAVDDRAGEWASEAEASVLGGGGGGLSWGTGGGCRGERLNELVSCWVGSIYAQEVVRRYERYQVHCCSTSVASRFSAIGPMMPMQPPPCEKTCSGLVIDGRMSKFIKLLANDADQQLKVVSIHGSGCLGKTMLANVLYNKIGRQFHCRAFIRVCKKPDMKRLFRDMLSQIQRKQPQASQDAYDELHITAENIRNYLHGKRYLFSTCK